MAAPFSLSYIIGIAYSMENDAKTPLDRKVEQVINLIKVKITELSIVDAAKKLLPHIQDLRNGILDFYKENNVIAEKYTQDKEDYSGVEGQVTRFPELAQKVAESLRIQKEVFTAISQISGFENYNQIPDQLEKDQFKEDLLEPENVVLRHMATTSEKLEFCSIVANLILKGGLVVPKAKIKELIEFTDDNACSYGGYAMLLGWWEPREEDNSRMAQKIELMASIYSVDYARGYKLTEDGSKVSLYA